MRCGAAKATGRALFVMLLSTVVCCQPTELFWSLFFVSYIFQFYPPPPHTGQQLVHLFHNVLFFYFTPHLGLHRGDQRSGRDRSQNGPDRQRHHSQPRPHVRPCRHCGYRGGDACSGCGGMLSFFFV